MLKALVDNGDSQALAALMSAIGKALKENIDELVNEANERIDELLLDVVPREMNNQLETKNKCLDPTIIRKGRGVSMVIVPLA